MFLLLIAIILLKLQDDGILALFIVALLEQLFLHLCRSPAEAHLMQLRHVVHQAETAAGIGVDHEIHKAHDALGRLIEGKGLCGPVLSHQFEKADSLGVFPREEAEEGKAAQVEAGDGKRIHGGAAAGNSDDTDSGLNRGLDEFVPWIGDAGRAGVGDDGDVLAFQHLLHKPVRFSMFVELVV